MLIRMPRWTRYGCLALLMIGISRPAPADELQRLREENAVLRAQLQVLQQKCPSPDAAAPVSSALPGAPPPAAPEGYRLVKEPEPYSRTGCSEGLFSAGPDAPWKHAENWRALERGMSADEVEALLGPEHYNVGSGARIAWQYGKCGAKARGTVVYQNGQLRSWKAPSL
jgi:hypothetical protein